MVEENTYDGREAPYCQPLNGGISSGITGQNTERHHNEKDRPCLKTSMNSNSESWIPALVGNGNETEKKQYLEAG